MSPVADRDPVVSIRGKGRMWEGKVVRERPGDILVRLV